MKRDQSRCFGGGSVATELPDLVAQVLARYGVYGDSILGRFGVKDDGHKIPNVRAVIKPLIGLFYGEVGGRRWRNAIDRVLLQKPATVSEVIQVRSSPLPTFITPCREDCIGPPVELQLQRCRQWFTRVWKVPLLQGMHCIL